MKRREGRGFWEKCPFHLPPPVPVKQGRGTWAPAAALAGGPGHDSGREEGGKGESDTGDRFPSSIWVVAACRGGATVAGGSRRHGVRSGGAAGLGEKQ